MYIRSIPDDISLPGSIYGGYWLFGTYQICLHLFKNNITFISRRNFEVYLGIKQKRMPHATTLKKQLQRNERCRICTEVGTSSKNMVHRKASKFKEERGGLVQSICSISLDEIAMFVADREKKEEMNKNVRPLNISFSKHDFEVLVYLVKSRLQYRDCTSFVELLISLCRVAGWYSPCLKNYVEKGNVMFDRVCLRKPAKHVFHSDKFGTNKRMWNGFVLLDSDCKEGSVLFVAKQIFLLRLNDQNYY